MHHCIGIETRENVGDRRTIADIGPAKAIAWMALNASERSKIAGISQLVDDQHLVIAARNEMPDQRRSDKPRATGDYNSHL